MRVYIYLPKTEILFVGAKGALPTTPHNEVDKVLQSFVDRYPEKIPELKVGKNKKIKLSTRAVHGAPVTSAISLVSKMGLHPNGILAFFHTNKRYMYPLIMANYKYKLIIMDLLTLRTHSEYYKIRFFSSLQNALDYYSQLYWNSAITAHDFYNQMKIAVEVESILSPSEVRKREEMYEVLYYGPIPPQYIYVALEHKKRIYFLEWLYRHRGLYNAAMSNAKTELEKGHIERLYDEFLANYKKYMNPTWINANMRPPSNLIYLPWAIS